jgi:hypothetical protein
MTEWATLTHKARWEKVRGTHVAALMDKVAEDTTLFLYLGEGDEYALITRANGVRHSRDFTGDETTMWRRYMRVVRRMIVGYDALTALYSAEYTAVIEDIYKEMVARQAMEQEEQALRESTEGNMAMVSWNPQVSTWTSTVYKVTNFKVTTDDS